MRRLNMFILVLLGTILFAMPASAGVYVEPTFDTAVVDGNFGEWDLNEDYVFSLYRDGDGAQPVLARVYFRYDCLTSQMYVLVLSEQGVPVPLRPDEIWIFIVGRYSKTFQGNPSLDYVTSNFSWVDPTFGDASFAWGYEGRFFLQEGLHEMIMHMQVLEGGLFRTAATVGYPDLGMPVMINCGVTPVEPTTWGRIKQVYP